jgi:AcrR family transcriptional regulator
MSALPQPITDLEADEFARRRQIKPDVVAFKRGKILEQASALFSARGYSAATLDMIAERLHVTKPFLYTYFRNKSDILAAICEVGVSESLAALDKSANLEGSAADRLKAALTDVARIIIHRQPYIVVYQREMMALERSDAQRIMRLRHEFDLRVSRMVEDCRSEGSVTLPDATMMSVWIGGLLSWIANYHRPGSRKSEDDLVEQAVTACLRLVGLA